MTVQVALIGGRTKTIEDVWFTTTVGGVYKVIRHGMTDFKFPLASILWIEEQKNG